MCANPTEIAWSTHAEVCSPVPSVHVPYAMLGMLVPTNKRHLSALFDYKTLNLVMKYVLLTVVELDQFPRHCAVYNTQRHASRLWVVVEWRQDAPAHKTGATGSYI